MIRPSAFLQAIQLRPGDAFTHFHLAIASSELGRTRRDWLIQKSNRYRSHDVGASPNLAITHSLSGRHEASIETWRRFIELKSDDVAALSSLEVKYKHQLGAIKALDAALHVARLDPSAVSLGNVAVFFNRLRNFDDGLRKARDAIRSTSVTRTATSMPSAFQGLEDQNAAYPLFRKALEL